MHTHRHTDTHYTHTIEYTKLHTLYLSIFLRPSVTVAVTWTSLGPCLSRIMFRLCRIMSVSACASAATLRLCLLPPLLAYLTDRKYRLSLTHNARTSPELRALMQEERGETRAQGRRTRIRGTAQRAGGVRTASQVGCIYVASS